MTRKKNKYLSDIAAIFAIAGITVYAMHLQIDGAMVPIIGVAIISGIAGYETGVLKGNGLTDKLKNKGD